MKFYTQQHKFYCGIDLHTKKMFVCILDAGGNIRIHQNINTDPETFLNIITPFREDIVVAVECMFTWYWIADLCVEHHIPFVLNVLRQKLNVKTKQGIDDYRLKTSMVG